jgi:hypothetical protein
MQKSFSTISTVTQPFRKTAIIKLRKQPLCLSYAIATRLLPNGSKRSILSAPETTLNQPRRDKSDRMTSSQRREALLVGQPLDRMGFHPFSYPQLACSHATSGAGRNDCLSTTDAGRIRSPFNSLTIFRKARLGGERDFSLW